MLKKILRWGLDFLFPPSCVLCDQGEELLCDQCFKGLQHKEASCPKCSQINKLGEFCPQCQKEFYLQGVLVAGDFTDKKLAKLIKLYKYNFISDLGLYLAKFMYNFLKNNVLVNPILNFKTSSDKFLNLDNYLIIATPLSKKRMRFRGFNQSLILAKYISKKLGLEISEQLIRVKHRQAQAKLSLVERKENLKNCFKWTGKSLQGKNILLIDDVCTSASTLNEMARELKKHQAGIIWGLVLAKN